MADTELPALLARGAGATLDDAGFDALARRVFAEQFETCAPYRAFCERRGRAPAAVGHWTEIPAVPTAAFAETVLAADPPPYELVFETSGTTRERTGRHHLSARAVALYRASMLPTFRHYVLPELEERAATAAAAGPRSALVPLVLGPSPAEAPHSSLAFMLDGVSRAFCAQERRFFLGPAGLDLPGLAGALGEAERDGRPVLLLGTALGLLAVAERWRAEGTRFFLPRGSRAMETGGAKGRRTAVDPAELRGLAAAVLGIDEAWIANEYGMTEACSQFYDAALREAWEAARTCDLAPGGERPGARLRRGPPWARALVCDPETLEPAAPGTTGVLRLVDLANRYSLSFLQTSDLAVAPEPGPSGPGSAPFDLLGRAAGAEARGCSLAAEEWTRALRGGEA